MRHRSLYQQTGFPVFQNRMYDTPKSAQDCPRGDIRIVQNSSTGLIYNEAFDANLVHYDSAYQNEQGNSAIFDAHMDQIVDLITKNMDTESVIEVGCGKGLFLEKMRGRGVKITGFDPAYEGSDPTIVKAVFDERVPMQGKSLILRHVLEHIPDPVQFLSQLKVANGHGGLIYIEVPCFDWILENRAWFDLFYEHVNYFRLEDFYRMFGSVVYAGRSFSGQYLSIVADLSTLRSPSRRAEDRVELPDAFLPDLRHKTDTISGIWGGASKGVIFSLLLQRAGHQVTRVIDINPAKQGKFLPGTGLLVEEPNAVLSEIAPGSTIIVMNPNYFDEIRTMGGPTFNYRSVHDL